MDREERQLNAAGRKAAKELGMSTIVSIFKDPELGIWYRDKSGCRGRMNSEFFQFLTKTYPGHMKKLENIEVPSRKYPNYSKK